MKKLAMIGLVVAIVIAGAFLWLGFERPADHHAQRRSSRPTASAAVTYSKDNLLQIGISFRIWAEPHHGQFPFNVSQTDGGTRELCHRDGDGFEMNPAPVFMAMTQELYTPKVLVCPNDRTKKAAANWASLTANNISYKLRTGANISLDHPAEILAIDPVNGLALHCDGSVEINRQ